MKPVIGQKRTLTLTRDVTRYSYEKDEKTGIARVVPVVMSVVETISFFIQDVWLAPGGWTVLADSGQQYFFV